MLAATLRGTKLPASSTVLPYRGLVEQLVKQTAECARLMAEAAKFVVVDQRPQEAN